MLASNMPAELAIAGSGLMHYALGSWRECVNANCEEADGVKIHSMGAEGFYPWIWRKGRDSHWGILSQQGMIGVAPGVSSQSMKTVFPLARKAMEQMPTTSTTSTTSTTTSATTTKITLNSVMISAGERIVIRAGIAMLGVVVSVFLRIG
jgi:hypothetical protein